MNKIIQDMLEDGVNYQGIKNALENGYFLSAKQWTQEEVEEAHDEIYVMTDVSKG